MADFEAALENLLKAEGGFAREDNGKGSVNFGITASFLKLIGKPNSPADVLALTKDDASRIYQKYFWDAFKIGQMNDQRVATLLFHMVVNNPAKIAVMSFQLALQDAGIPVPATGFVGPKTTTGANRLGDARDLFIRKFKGRMLDRYNRLAASSPKYADDLKGWERRLAAL